MKGNSFITVASICAATGSICYAAGTRVAQTSQSVYVANTTSQPIPVSLYHTIAVSTRPSNTATTPLFGRDVDNAYIYSTSVYLNNGVDYSYAAIPSPPAGKRLILTHVSANCGTGAPATSARLYLTDKLNTTLSYRAFFMNPDPGGTSITAGGMDTFVEINPTDLLKIYVYRSATNFGDNIYLDLEGYYVNVP